MPRCNAPLPIVRVERPTKGRRVGRVVFTKPKPRAFRESDTADIMDILDDMISEAAPKPKPRRESALLVIRDEPDTTANEPIHSLPPDYDAIFRMQNYDNWPRPIREFFHEYSSDLDMQLVNYEKVRAALREHPAEKVAEAMTKKCEEARKRRQFERLTTVEFD
jgi:hypothetical protein